MPDCSGVDCRVNPESSLPGQVHSRTRETRNPQASLESRCLPSIRLAKCLPPSVFTFHIRGRRAGDSLTQPGTGKPRTCLSCNFAYTLVERYWKIDGIERPIYYRRRSLAHSLYGPYTAMRRRLSRVHTQCPRVREVPADTDLDQGGTHPTWLTVGFSSRSHYS